MARSTKNRKNTKQVIEEAAELAAEEAMEDLDTESSFEDDGIEISFDPSEISVDVFEEGFRKAIAAKDSPRYHIKKNSQFLTVKDYPYSWEQLQKDFGSGWYQVQCKARSSGRILKSQTEMVGDPNEGKVIEDQNEHHDTNEADKNLAVLGWLQSSQERAEQRAREQAKQSENGLATVMQAVMTAQQESSKTMMQMMMESSKQTQNLMIAMMQNQSQNQQKGPDPLLTLLSTMITQQNKGEGFTTANVIKMIQDAETRAEQRTTKNYEWLEKKSNELAEIKAEAMLGSEEQEESLTKSLLKGFVPVLSQMVAQGGQPVAGQVQQQQLNPAQQAALLAQRQEQMTQASLRPGIAGNPQVVRQQARPQAPKVRPVQAEVQPVQKVEVKRPVLDAQQKEAVFSFVGGDIGQAMISGSQASTTAEQVLLKLEKEGVARQTIAKGFALDDFYGFASRYIPEESLAAAKTWLKEFYDAIQGLAVSSNAKSTDGTSAESSETKVSAKRGQAGTTRARTQSESTSTNI